MEKLGNGWEELCEGISDKLRSKNEKSITMKRKMHHYRRENMKSRQAEEDFNRTKESYERSLSEINTIYEKS
jgi:hypothetical protein